MTDKLRAMLDERGIEHFDHENGEPLRDLSEAGTDPATSWRMGDASVCAVPNKYGTFDLWIDNCTPEQAIAATVGRGNLTAEQVREAIMSADRWRKPMGDTGMTNTHLIIRDDGWQAIADELNAMVGVGTCELINAADDLGEGTSSCMCSKCGYTALDDWWDEFKHCPNCGARLVGA